VSNPCILYSMVNYNGADVIKVNTAWRTGVNWP